MAYLVRRKREGCSKPGMDRFSEDLAAKKACHLWKGGVIGWSIKKTKKPCETREREGGKSKPPLIKDKTGPGRGERNWERKRGDPCKNDGGRQITYRGGLGGLAQIKLSASVIEETDSSGKEGLTRGGTNIRKGNPCKSDNEESPYPSSKKRRGIKWSRRGVGIHEARENLLVCGRAIVDDKWHRERYPVRRLSRGEGRFGEGIPRKTRFIVLGKKWRTPVPGTQWELIIRTQRGRNGARPRHE